MRTVIFDLDGTLADTSGDLIAAANACFNGLGHSAMLDPKKDAGVALRGGRAMLKLGFARLGNHQAEDQIDTQYPVLLAAYGAAIDRFTVLYPGAREAVMRLKDAGYRVGICTNKPEALAEQLMQSLKFRDVFDALVGADTLPVRKPDPAPFRAAVERAGGSVRSSLLVGDSDTDRNTAKAAGVASVLVTFSPAGHSVADLAPEALLHGYDEIDAVVSGLIG